MYCPPMRNGIDVIVMAPKGKPEISEQLCIACGICTHKCPFDAIRIIQLASELDHELIHAFGVNEFKLFRLPVPREREVVGLLGANGTGKTTCINILAGKLVPNLGNYNGTPSWDTVLDVFSKTQLGKFLKKVVDSSLNIVIKPQNIDAIPRFYKGTARELLTKNISEERIKDFAARLNVESTLLDRDIRTLSGGELQSLALIAALSKAADFYFLDEPSNYLDIYQRLNVARVIKELAQQKTVMVVEHDLAILDYIADYIHIIYGEPGSYGVVTQIRAVRTGINTYLDGFLREENVRFRSSSIKFTVHDAKGEFHGATLFRYPSYIKTYNGFSVQTSEGIIHKGEVIGILGPNATGKTTFVKMLAGEIQPSEVRTHDSGTIHEAQCTISYKPQYIKFEFDGTVSEYLRTTLKERVSNTFFNSEVIHPLGINHIKERQISELSGGETQILGLAVAFGKEADLYIFDEPSAFLDANMRMCVAKIIQRFIQKTGKSAFVVDHDIYFIDIVADSLIVFEGVSGKYGVGIGPFTMRNGMNRFLEKLEITFRRDEDSLRPRINKPGSYLHREQIAKKDYYYES